MGLNINGKVICYKNEFGYSTAISNKKQDGTYERMYVSLQLPKGVEVENKTYIEITRGFLAFYKTKEGLSKIKIVVLDFNYINDSKNNNNDYRQNDLPF